MRILIFSLLALSLLPISLYARQFVLVISHDDIKDSPDSAADPDSPEWDEFGDSSDAHKSDEELDPGSWRPIFEPDASSGAGAPEPPASKADALYYSGVSKMISAVSSGDEAMFDDGASEIEAAAAAGHAHAQSVRGFLHGTGQMREKNKAKAFMYHYFAANGGNMQSKMTLAYTYFKQDVSSLRISGLCFSRFNNLGFRFVVGDDEFEDKTFVKQFKKNVKNLLLCFLFYVLC